MLIKTPLLHQSSGPRVFLSLSLSPSLSFSGWSPGAQRLSEFTFLPGLLRPSREGALLLHLIERAPEASVNRASPVSGALLAFCVNQGIYQPLSRLYFLIVDSRPAGSGPLKDLNNLLNVLTSSRSFQIFYSYSVLLGCMFLGIYPFLRCWKSSGLDID